MPKAEFRSYYGRPVIKAPIWHEPHMPLYLFLGGVSGASSMLGAGARLSGRHRLALSAEVTAALSAAAGAGLLVAELGRPERFLNMLRVFKLTSPMSVGSWILAAHSGMTGLAAGSAVTGLLPRLGTAAFAGGGVTGPLMATYTAVLVADTAVPAWHEGHRELPFLFAGSALASAGAAVMLATPPGEAGPARRAALIGATLETAAGHLMEHRLGMLAEPYREGPAGRTMRAARLLTVTGGALAALAEAAAVPSPRPRRPARARFSPLRPAPRAARPPSVPAVLRGMPAVLRELPAVLRGMPAQAVLGGVSALALAAGAVCTRFAVLRAGRASAEDPKYTVVPQRERVSARESPDPTPGPVPR
ncbi:NrfD/PsrC family molybdoenzyme membrane anchor subunit [Microtetraspora sp. NBRC 13810]|uniref:NrfD/PsrC family molybdoenzyme membrane anchor subunit n=1 Tax=Microtetraspora sp. NBRC 13810 TaxID=3030990 RepID=UPI002556E333|nr:NrfD/PsrC family molybdoenzyme membrane anchor subunit [Microtetraspora sp. NBRC 13810]